VAGGGGGLVGRGGRPWGQPGVGASWGQGAGGRSSWALWEGVVGASGGRPRAVGAAFVAVLLSCGLCRQILVCRCTFTH